MKKQFREMTGWSTYNGMTRIEAIHKDDHTLEDAEAYWRQKYPQASGIRIERCNINGFSAYEAVIYN